MDKSTFFCLNQVSEPNVEKDKKNWKYTFLQSFFKATNLADIHEYVRALEPPVGLEPGTFGVELRNLIYYASKLHIFPMNIENQY